MKTEQLYGTGVALVTPFAEDGSVDLPALRRIVRHCIDGGVDYLVVLGTTGEAVTLDESEKTRVVQTVIDENNGSLPLVIGIGGNNTARLVDELKKSDLSAFTAVLSVSPYYNKPTQEGIYRHYQALADASPLPVILYNVPGRTGSNMLPSTVARIARDCPNVVAIKEACGNMDQIRELIRTVPEGFNVISGDDITALPTILEGGIGVISVLGQGMPVQMSSLVRHGLNGEYDKAQQIHEALKPGMDLIFQEGNPAGIKAIFELLGISGAGVRLPLVEASPQLKSKISSFIEPFAITI
ncbi:4-hydroxy-tetrahydrodipicolinate synthase [Muriicola jejuensis]|uniref:4-hydroxy-tetrahydrodipicolinate synthase n=1 Tax=Muriicola jejuensis TaxID=504488 RepID=A0A6P0UEK7_9FLAO|nr:4-hydroxy-tetrahydrodipicolinate synthase [Muriicola jejuensis]NER11062.1 4-hydroxy-tetrahydrodipicolinate synthase [Muriicola jejuensis]SMP23257.1 4-hydroxy-tetrahydrodipicolinate synthase [Muriicola jejuensis]